MILHIWNTDEAWRDAHFLWGERTLAPIDVKNDLVTVSNIVTNETDAYAIVLLRFDDDIWNTSNAIVDDNDLFWDRSAVEKMRVSQETLSSMKAQTTI